MKSSLIEERFDGIIRNHIDGIKQGEDGYPSSTSVCFKDVVSENRTNDSVYCDSKIWESE